MNNFIKAVLAATYALACISLFVPFPQDAAAWLQKISLILLAVHVLETAVMFRHVKKYQGPLATSILLSLLFGLLHWMPLAKRQEKA